MDKALIVELRKKTGCGVGDCLAALQETNGDMDAAIDVLRKKGLKTAAKRADRNLGEGVVTSYIHAGGKVGVLLELNCETDFVARNDAFQTLAHDLAMHTAASAPDYVKTEDVPVAVLEKEKDILREQLKAEGKPEAMIEKILDGKLAKFYEEHCLMKQPFIKDDTKKVEDLINTAVAALGENITVGRFVRYGMGQ